MKPQLDPDSALSQPTVSNSPGSNSPGSNSPGSESLGADAARANRVGSELPAAAPTQDAPTQESTAAARPTGSADSDDRGAGNQGAGDRGAGDRGAGDRLQPTADLLAELEHHSRRLETASPRAIIQWAVERFGDRLTMGTAFGPEGMVILHWLAEIRPETHVFNLETGYQFPETLELRDEVERRYGINVRLERPELTVEQYEQKHGGPLYRTHPNQCCLDRKIRVLHRAIIGRHAWISAIRRDQSPDRAHAAIVGWDPKFNLVKINPLANSTKQDIWKWITDFEIPYNPLHDRGYTSIGCWPCTRAVTFGEDERAGRWSGSEKTECGLHSID